MRRQHAFQHYVAAAARRAPGDRLGAGKMTIRARAAAARFELLLISKLVPRLACGLDGAAGRVLSEITFAHSPVAPGARKVDLSYHSFRTLGKGRRL